MLSSRASSSSSAATATIRSWSTSSARGAFATLPPPPHASLHRSATSSQWRIAAASCSCCAYPRALHTRSALSENPDDPVAKELSRTKDKNLLTVFAAPTSKQKNSRVQKFTNTYAPKKFGHVVTDPTAVARADTVKRQGKKERKQVLYAEKRPTRDAQPFVFTGFPVPTRPSLSELGNHIGDQINALGEWPELADHLIAYGLSHETTSQLLKLHDVQRKGSRKQPAEVDYSNDQAAVAVKLLFTHWSELATAQVRATCGAKASSTSASAEAATTEGSETPAHQTYFHNDLEGIRDSYAIEGRRCLSRFCLSAFLDWVEASAIKLVSETSTDAATRETLNSTLSQLSLLRQSTDLRLPTYRFPVARSLTRQIHLHIGPTNSGKTHGALVALSKARTGVFAGPLRLLAHEVWERFNDGTISPGVPPRACNLVTGEEQKMVDPMAGLVACTVEMVNNSRAIDVAVVDEIQMIGDPHRGYAWTEAVIGLPAKEIHLCGEASTVPLIRRIAEACGDDVFVHEYKRLTPLSIAEESLEGDLTRIKKGDCIVAFSRNGIFDLKREIEEKTKLTCAVAYGALPPETKSEQAKLFNEGKLDVMVASDAIGMGLNLKIKRVIFDSLTKWNGRAIVPLSTSQIKQIAGRAGRYGTKRDEKEPDGGIVTTRNANELEMLREALSAPVMPINQAAIQPSRDALADLAALLPPAPSSSAGGDATSFRSLSEIFTDISLLAQVDPKSFFLSDFKQQQEISPVVEKASRSLLTLQEREVFGNAPANTRDERLMAFLSNCVRNFSLGRLVKFDACCTGLGMIEVEKLAIEAMKEAEELRAKAHRTAGEARRRGDKSALTREQVDAEPLASHLSPGNPLLSIDTLMLLESLHRSLSLYLWLSFRFPLAFCYRTEVEERKKKMELGIEFCLEGIRFGRARRLRALGRDADAEQTLKKKGWKAQNQRPRGRSSERW